MELVQVVDTAQTPEAVPWQTYSIGLLVAVVVISLIMRSFMMRKANAAGGDYMARACADLRAARQAGETEPAIVQLGEYKKFSKGRSFVMGLTDQRLYVYELNRPLRSFVRDESLHLCAKEKTWTQTGNTSVRITKGWEVELTTPQGEKYKCRMYAQAYGYDDQPQMIDHFLRALDAR
jgi:hypothetical protein